MRASAQPSSSDPAALIRAGVYDERVRVLVAEDVERRGTRSVAHDHGVSAEQLTLYLSGRAFKAVIACVQAAHLFRTTGKRPW